MLAYSQILRGRFAPVFLFFEANLDTFVEAAQTSLLHCRDVHEHVPAAVVGLDKSITLGWVEPLHSTYRHVHTPF